MTKLLENIVLIKLFFFFKPVKKISTRIFMDSLQLWATRVITTLHHFELLSAACINTLQSKTLLLGFR